MVPALRKRFNERFTTAKYEAFLGQMEAAYPGQLDFRIAETPLFIPKTFTRQMLDACEHIIDVIISPEYKQQSSRAIPAICACQTKTITHILLHLILEFARVKTADSSPSLSSCKVFPRCLPTRLFFLS
jgi:hypothetical protein